MEISPRVADRRRRTWRSFRRNIDLSSLDGSNGFKLSGNGALDGLGTTVASAGDINGDGLADLIVDFFPAS